MKIRRMEEMTRGWFVGDFVPTAFRTQNVEVAVKNYQAGDLEAAHYHKIATELTVVVSGVVRIGKDRYATGDIIIIEPEETVDFEAITDAVNVVVKIPGAQDDKYVAGGES